MTVMICRVAIAGLALLGFSANLLAEPQDDYFRKLFVLDSDGFPRGLGSITLDSSFSGGADWTLESDRDSEYKSYLYEYENGDTFRVSAEGPTGEVSYMAYTRYTSDVEFKKNLGQYLYDNFRQFNAENSTSGSSATLSFSHGGHKFSVLFADTYVVIVVRVEDDWDYYY